MKAPVLTTKPQFCKKHNKYNEEMTEKDGDQKMRAKFNLFLPMLAPRIKSHAPTIGHVCGCHVDEGR